MKKIIILSSLVLSASAQASSFHCNINLHQFSDLSSEVSQEMEQSAPTDQAQNSPDVVGIIQAVDTTMPQTRLGDFVLKHIKIEGRSVFRSTPKSHWVFSEDKTLVVFDISKREDQQRIKTEISFPKNTHLLKAGDFFTGLLHEEEENGVPSQAMPLDCWID